MATRLLLAAVAVLASAAAGDALRGAPAEEAAEEVRVAPDAPPATALVLGSAGDFAADGRFLRKRVLRAGSEHLSAEAVEGAFPGEDDGPLDISRLALAPDGTLVLAVYRFPAGRPAVGALELWRERTLVGSFPVTPRDFGGGLAFEPAGSLVATVARDGSLRGVYDRRGRRVDRRPGASFVVFG